MGARISKADRASKARSDAIDKQIKEDSKRYKRECKILVLESGTSTIVRQMKVVHGLTHEELESYRPIVYKNVLDSVQAIILAMRKMGVEPERDCNKALIDPIINYRLDDTTAFTLSPEIANSIHQLWQDPIIPRVMDEHNSEFYAMDIASYFLSEALRIGTPSYLPTETDFLCAQPRNTGITETHFTMGQLSLHMCDVSRQQSEHKKWIHCFENVTSIIFCVALSDYDNIVLEGCNQNRLTESLVFFESVVNSRWFLQTSIILFLTKLDVFKNKLSKVPLEQYFPDYMGGPDINKATRYILWRFMQVNRARLSIYPRLTQATDPTNIRLVFSAVKVSILQNALKDLRNP